MDLDRAITIGLQLNELEAVPADKRLHNKDYESKLRALVNVFNDLIDEEYPDEVSIPLANKIKSVISKHHKEGMKIPELYEEFREYLIAMFGLLQLLDWSTYHRNDIVWIQAERLIVAAYEYLQDEGVTVIRDEDISLLSEFIEKFQATFKQVKGDIDEVDDQRSDD